MNALNKFRLAKKMSYQNLATLVPYGTTAVWNHCKSLKIPAEAAVHYARILGIPLHELRPDLWGGPEQQVFLAQPSSVTANKEEASAT